VFDAVVQGRGSALPLQKDFMVFMPIPQREIDLDPAVGQNPGY